LLWRVRFNARGSVLGRLGELRRQSISSMVRATAFLRWSGGKIRLPGDLAADDTERAQERDSVRVYICFVGSPTHESAYGLVGSSRAHISCSMSSGDLDLSTRPGPRWWVLISSIKPSISHRSW
jgi:hypothetical protein